MKHSLSICFLILPIFLVLHGPAPASRSVGHFTFRVLAAHLIDPWSVCYGPDNELWITEAKSYKVSRIDPVTGDRQVILDLAGERRFPRYDSIGDDLTAKPWPEGGLTGMALHPQLLDGKPYVYLTYIYRFSDAADT